ncbi:hypothetical protein GCM10012275_45650 [Longimycelium tulufanense]|uniref:Uncharacterized protein n=1 Tax=Longimycelium tulufanense TaxID=907463 RepID=A0A8J3CBI5_9PSEU|nr:DUF6355 family natural product biosynthesis protein [Longimycelium tulufanense]GGM70076.1 hypothetical protein GCM10012275_45650 [Longimycelium tulufanense]
MAAVPGAAMAATPDGSAALLPACGWDPNPATNQAWYNHCTSDGSRVLIRVEVHAGRGSSYDKCVPPGQTYLGTLDVVRYAWYKGQTC